ncbi:MAG TPA: hypothetical protein VFC84_02195 [Desulfosporosinus sp.]|nr:hypothetical protein [Desulfosporosinus sp.]
MGKLYIEIKEVFCRECGKFYQFVVGGINVEEIPCPQCSNVMWSGDADLVEATVRNITIDTLTWEIKSEVAEGRYNGETVALMTYVKNDGDTDNGRLFTIFTIPTEYAREKIAQEFNQTLEEFLVEYTGDSTDGWPEVAAQEGMLIEGVGEQPDASYRDVGLFFAEYEAEGYSQKFWTPYTDHRSRIGEAFKVVRRLGDKEDEVDSECLPMWKIRFKDGFEVSAFPEEIIPSAILSNGGQI